MCCRGPGRARVRRGLWRHQPGLPSPRHRQLVCHRLLGSMPGRRGGRLKPHQPATLSWCAACSYSRCGMCCWLSSLLACRSNAVESSAPPSHALHCAEYEFMMVDDGVPPLDSDDEGEDPTGFKPCRGALPADEARGMGAGSETVLAGQPTAAAVGALLPHAWCVRLLAHVNWRSPSSLPQAPVQPPPTTATASPMPCLTATTRRTPMTGTTGATALTSNLVRGKQQ